MNRFVKKIILGLLSLIFVLIPMAKASELTTYDPAEDDLLFCYYLEFEFIGLINKCLPQGEEYVRRLIRYCIENKIKLDVWHYTGEDAERYRAQNPHNLPVYFYF